MPPTLHPSAPPAHTCLIAGEIEKMKQKRREGRADERILSPHALGCHAGGGEPEVSRQRWRVSSTGPEPLHQLGLCLTRESSLHLRCRQSEVDSCWTFDFCAPFSQARLLPLFTSVISEKDITCLNRRFIFACGEGSDLGRARRHQPPPGPTLVCCGVRISQFNHP